VIEWRLNSSIGTTVFVSGEGSDASIQAQHPIINEVVFSGTLYPIIKYAYVNSFKYSLYYDPTARYSPDFINCLNPIIIENIDCCTYFTSSVSDYIYPYFLQYVNTADYGANKSRTLKYNICPSIAYLAWEFDAYSVPEQIKISYCTSANYAGTLLDNFVHGITGLVENLYPTNYPINPRVYIRGSGTTQGMKYITRFNDVSHNVGDYLKIEIIGSVYDPSNNNTNWDLKLKSLSIDISSGWTTSKSMSKLITTPSPSLFYDTTNCLYELDYYTTGISQDFTYGKTSTYYPYSSVLTAYPAIWKYMELNILQTYNPMTRTMWNPYVSDSLRWSTSITNYTWGDSNYNSCINCNPNQNITMSMQTNDVSAWVYTFTDASDYNAFVYDVSSIRSYPWFINAVNSPDSSLQYYAYYTVIFREASTCGDVGIDYSQYFHHTSDISFNAAAKTIKFIPNIPVNNIVNVSCNTAHQQVTGLISQFNYTKIGTYVNPLTTKISQVRKQGPVISYMPQPWYQFDSHLQTAQGYRIHESLLNNVFDVSSLGFGYEISTGDYEGYDVYFKEGYWGLIRNWDKLSFTGSTADSSARLKHWKLERVKFLRTDVYSDITWETIYDISIA
jgi:hypothetical protein